jgi:N-acetylmuramate 1-kinase
MTDRTLPALSGNIERILRDLGHQPPFEAAIAGSAGSGRIYWRIGTFPRSHILLVSHALDADYDRFLSVSRHLRHIGLDVPTIHGSDDAVRQVVLEDLGSVLLLQQAHEAGFPGEGDGAALQAAYLPVLRGLADWQDRGTRHMRECPELVDRVFDLGPLLWETSYFSRRCAEESYDLPPERLAEPDLLAELHKLAVRVEGHEYRLMHRDFQSQNLMCRDGAIWFIDYQGARPGSRWYDLASLLWDPYVAMPMDLRRTLFDRFVELAPAVSREEAWEQLLDAALQRVMQALGAYGFLSRRKGLPWFSRFLVPGVAILSQTLQRRGGHPALRRLVDELGARVPLPMPSQAD